MVFASVPLLLADGSQTIRPDAGASVTCDGRICCNDREVWLRGAGESHQVVEGIVPPVSQCWVTREGTLVVADQSVDLPQMLILRSRPGNEHRLAVIDQTTMRAVQVAQHTWERSVASCVGTTCLLVDSERGLLSLCSAEASQCSAPACIDPTNPSDDQQEDWESMGDGLLSPDLQFAAFVMGSSVGIGNLRQGSVVLLASNGAGARRGPSLRSLLNHSHGADPRSHCEWALERWVSDAKVGLQIELRLAPGPDASPNECPHQRFRIDPTTGARRRVTNQ